MPVGSQYLPARPPAALAAHVRRYLGYREHSATPVRRRQAPVGSCALIIGFGHRIRLDGVFGPFEAEAFVAGMSDTHVLTEFRGEQYGMQVDLTPLGLYTLLGRPMSDLTNQVPVLGQLGDPELAALPERLAALPDWPARFAHIDDVLARRLLDERARRPAPEVRYAWDRLAGTGGAAAVGDLATETGWSRRHLLNRFQEQVGVGPKTAGRVLRFERASGLVASGSGPLADVAAHCGYSDQAHLVREFRSLAGVTPSTYRAEWLASMPDMPEPAPPTPP